METNRFFTFLERTLMEPMGKLAQKKLIRAIMAASMSTIPFTIVGSLFLVFNVLPESIPALQGFFNATFFRFSDLYMVANSAAMSFLALYFAIVLGYEYTKIYAEEESIPLNPMNGALLSVFAVLMAIPQVSLSDGRFTRVHDEGAQILQGWAIWDGVARLGSTGIFAAIVMTIIAVQVYRLCVQKNFVIKMPDGVPEGVSRAFTALIPATLVSFLVIVMNGLFALAGTDLYGIIRIPFSFVTELTDSWLGILVIYFLVHSLWIVGIHGPNVIGAFLGPISLANMAANAEGANYVIAGEFHTAFVYAGGGGATLGLVFLMAYLAKSDRLRILGKTALVPSIFNINEPVIFGTPIIYNPYLAIPFFLAPMVTATIGYFVIKLGIMNPVMAMQPWPMPIGLSGYIATGGDIWGFIIGLLNGLIATLIYLPFFRMYDAKLVKEEQAGQNLGQSA